MRIAIIGTGIAGNVAAHHLHREHELTLYEAGRHVGGHSNTVDVELAGRRHAVDTGFIVFNERNYPQFSRLLQSLGVASQPAPMSFSVRCEGSGLEYAGSSLNTLFAQRANLLRPAFYRMVWDILRFNRDGRATLAAGGEGITLGEHLIRHGYGRDLIEHYVVPMGAAIWSMDPRAMLQFPAHAFLRFCDNHGLLSVNDRPVWRTVCGGSREYVRRLTAGFRDRIRLATPVEWIRRRPGFVEVKARGLEVERYEQVFLACHSDQALRILSDASPLEREVLAAIPYQENEALLHCDPSLLPRRRLARAAWNYHLPAGGPRRATVTYDLSLLQGLDTPVPLCVTLNHGHAVDPDRVLARFTYHHPVYTAAGLAAQRRQGEVNGVQRTYYCGAYWGHGFHEDGVASALSALGHLHERHGDAQRDLRRTA
jgi:predicted NAD/FAD-binding protein